MSGSGGRRARHELRAAAKATVRRVVRSRGYDVVPLAAGLVTFQQRVLPSCSAVIDVGANVGQFAERVRDLGYRGRIVSFEPGREACDILAKRASRDGSWDVRDVALGAAAGEASLNVSANSVSSSLLAVDRIHLAAAPASATVAHEQVRVSTFDDEIGAELGDSLYLKLDVQGYELEALRGATRGMQRVAAVQVEVSFDALYTGQADWLTLCRHLQDAGFVVSYVEPGYEDPESGHMLQADLAFLRAER